MNIDFEDYSEMSRDARRALERERDELMERADVVRAHLGLLDKIGELLAENRRLQSLVDEGQSLADDLQQQVDNLQQQLDIEKQQRAESEMKLIEVSKLSVGVAKKAPEGDLIKALRTYVNRSKRKTADKRAFAKSAALEIAVANGMDLPEDLKAAIEALDDEQIEPKVNVQGDLVLEKNVEHENNKDND